LHRQAIKFPVSLRTRPSDRWALTPIEHAKLNASLICDAAHKAIQCIDFPNEVTLAEASYRRIAGHDTDGIGTKSDQRRKGA
jgi:hypothetical protein